MSVRETQDIGLSGIREVYKSELSATISALDEKIHDVSEIIMQMPVPIAVNSRQLMMHQVVLQEESIQEEAAIDELSSDEETVELLKNVLTCSTYCPHGIPEAIQIYQTKISRKELHGDNTPEETYGYSSDDIDYQHPPANERDDHPELLHLMQSYSPEAKKSMLQFSPELIRLRCDKFKMLITTDSRGRKNVLEICKLPEDPYAGDHYYMIYNVSYFVICNNQVFLVESPNSYYFRHFFEFSQSQVKNGLLDHESLEEISLKTPLYQLPNQYWSEWETMDSSAISTYQTMIYPMFLENLNPIIERLREERKEITITEFGSGSGNLAISILTNGSGVSRYHMLEFNHEEVQAASEKMRTLEQEHRIPEGMALVTQGDAATDKVSDANIVICCGLLTEQVLKNHQQAVAMLKNIASHVTPGGYLLIAGLAPTFICSENLVDLGFEVLKIFDHKYNRYFYVAQKIS